MTMQPGDYMALFEASHWRYPPIVVEQALALADKLEKGVTVLGKHKGQRTNFGELSALEAAHRLARFVCQLPAYDRSLVEKWLGGGE